MSKSPFNKKDHVKVVNSLKPIYNGLEGVVIHAGKTTGRVTVQLDCNPNQWFDFYPTSLELIKEMNCDTQASTDNA